MATIKVRQRLRRTLLIIAFLLFPAIYYDLSPYLIIAGAQVGVVSGSFIIFTLQFLSALLLGRAWCGWICPAHGLYATCRLVNDQPVKGGKLNWIKYIIWIIWIGVIVLMAFLAGGYKQIDFFFMTEHGLSATNLPSYIMFYLIAGFLALLALVLGRLAPCHYLCWMAPFMVIGSAIKNAVKWPSLHLRVAPENCLDCKLCTRNCPMSLDVHGMVRKGSMHNSECILCGECVDTCPKTCIQYAFGNPH